MNRVILFFARLAQRFIGWAHDRADRLVAAEMARNFPKGCAVLIVRHGCHSLPEGARARILRANPDARDYLIQMEDSNVSPAMTILEGQTYVCPLALRRAP